MKTHDLKGHYSRTILIEKPDQTWHLLKGGAVNAGAEFGMEVSVAAEGTRIVLDGRIDNSVGGVDSDADETSIVINGHVKPTLYGLSVEGDGSIVSIGKSGVLSVASDPQGYAVWIGGDSSKFVNRGLVENNLIVMTGIGDTAVNAGVIDAASETAFSVQGLNGHVINTATGRITANYGVYSNGNVNVTFDNHGVLKATQHVAYLSGDSWDTIVSDGRLVGDIEAFGGNDTVVLMGGTFKGHYYGGEGDDTLYTDNARYTLEEFAGQGDADAIYSSVSYTLPGNVERLTLIGKRFGGIGDDEISGNSGNNVLRGRAGDDRLDGLAGNDRLFGADGEDVFVARFHGRFRGGHDTIEDFHQGEDAILLWDWAIGMDFEHILAHAHDTADGVAIRADHSEVLIKGMTMGELTGDDFHIAV